MTRSKQPHLPFPKKYVSNYLWEIFTPLGRGECVTPVWVATAGRRFLTRFIVDNINLFKAEIPDYKKYLLVYVEPLDLTEESQAGYLRLIGKTFIEACEAREDLKIGLDESDWRVFDDDQSAYSKLLDALKKLISLAAEKEIEPVVFLGEIDELGFITSIFCNNLRSLWNRFNGRLHFVFLIKDVRLIFAKDYFGEELGYLFFQNIVYYPVSKENEEYLISHFEESTGYKLTEKKARVVGEMCDGHPYFLKLAIESLAKTDLSDSPMSSEEIKKFLQMNYEIRAVCERMIEVQTDRIRGKLAELATKKVYELPGEELQTLVALGLVKKEGKGPYEPFCQLFKDAILKTIKAKDVSAESSENKLVFDPSLNSVIFRGRAIGEELTRQEYDLLVYFLKAPDKVHSRDEVAEAIWGKESFDKYSDWAIDQLMSKLRKKLSQIGVGSGLLKTVRGRGYKFTQEN
jgi:DNA-binding winged helix-turn-helix (wHTH) protein